MGVFLSATLAEQALLISSIGGFLTAATAAIIRLRKGLKKEPPAPSVDVQTALNIFESLTETQDKRVKGLEERLEKLEQRVDECESEKLSLRQQLALYQKIAEDFR